MVVNRAPSVLVVLAAIAVSASLCHASDKTSEGVGLLTKATSLQNIHAQGSKPFQLRMHIHAEHIVAKPIDGDYAEIWMDPSTWRREIAFPGFTQLETGDAGSKWVIRSLEFRPRVVYLTTIAVEVFTQLPILQEEAIKSVRNKKISGSEGQCVQLVAKPGTRTRELCFDSSGALVRESFGKQQFEYGDFSKFGGKIFPKSIRVYEADSRVLEIRADEISAPGDSRPELFQHPATSHRMAACERWPAEPVKKVAPQYPEPARRSHQQGTVTLYALLSDQGTVEKTTVLESAGDSLDRSAAEAVKHWEYAPLECGTAPLPTEIEVQVNYELRVE